MRKTLSALMLVSSFGFCLPQMAFAGEEEAAEHHRALEEMRRLSGRNAWSGVERNFQLILKLQDMGESPTAEDWMLGAQAARAMGNMTECRERLASSVRISPEREAVDLLSEIDRTYGLVDLAAEKGVDATLTPAAMPFVPDQRKAIESAQKAVKEDLSFEGLLPAGTYTYGGEEFVLNAGTEVVEIQLAALDGRDPTEPFSFLYVGPRLDLGAAFTVGGEPSVEAGVVSPPSFSGMGARLSAGVEMGLSPLLGLYAEVGYHGLTSSVDRADSELLEADGRAFSGHQLRTGFLSLGPTFRFDALWLNVGPTVSMGVAQSTNADESDRDNIMWVTSGPMATVGGQAGVSYSVMEVGRDLAAAVSLLGGAQHDSQRLYPWGQFAVTLGPVPRTVLP
jgi:hypothetical protein